MRYQKELLVCLLSCGLMAPLQGKQREGEEGYRKRIYAHLLLANPKGAMREGERGLQEFPDSKSLLSPYLLALAERGEERKALAVWAKRGKFSLQDPIDRKMLEMIAWGVLKKGEASSQLLVKMNALVGAAMTRDVKAIPLILSQMSSSHATIRLVAIRLATLFGDEPLKQEILRLLKEEKVWFVRQELLAAAGQIRLFDAKTVLKEIIGSPFTLAEERAIAVETLAHLYDSIEDRELESLLNSDRAGLRKLGVDLIFRLNIEQKQSLVVRFLHDASAEVRVAALQGMFWAGINQIEGKKIESLLLPLLQDPSFEVGITAAFLLLIQGKREGEEALENWLVSERGECRRLASAALAVSGVSGIPLSLRAFEETQDPYVKVNLARGLLGQRVQTELAAKAIHDVLNQEKRALWMWEVGGMTRFASLAPSQVRHREGIANYPAVVDQHVRLELLSLLSRVEYPHVQEAMREFLKAKSWMVSGIAASLLLQEGQEADLDVVRQLVHDPDRKIRCLAALILGAVGRDSAALSVLQEVYPDLDRELKMHVLQTIGHIGDRESVPFLLGLLEEPFQILRVAAASALIQCLYH